MENKEILYTSTTDLKDVNIKKGFYNYLLNNFNKMYTNGFDVIGSFGKTPNLHKWSNVDRDVLYKQGIEDFNSQVANSINIRMADSDLIALDFDIPSDVITMDLVNALKDFHVFADFDSLFTVRAKKGLKIFLRYEGDKQKLSNSYGVKLEHCGYKYEFEVKKLLSTVCGLYPDNSTLYTAYRTNKLDTQFICNATYQGIEVVNDMQLQIIESIYNLVLAKRGLIHESYIQNFFGSYFYEVINDFVTIYFCNYENNQDVCCGLLRLCEEIKAYYVKNVLIQLKIYELTGSANIDQYFFGNLLQSLIKTNFTFTESQLQHSVITINSFYSSLKKKNRYNITKKLTSFGETNILDLAIDLFKYEKEQMKLQRQNKEGNVYESRV